MLKRSQYSEPSLHSLVASSTVPPALKASEDRELGDVRSDNDRVLERVARKSEVVEAWAAAEEHVSPESDQASWV